MTAIDIAPEVRQVIGDEQVRRFATEPHCRRGKCAECAGPVDADREPASVVLIPILTVAEPRTVMRLTHTACKPSQIYPPFPGTVNADKVYGVAGLLPTASHERGRPIVLLKFPEIITATPPGDRIDEHAAYLHGHGFELMARPGRPPQAPAAGWTLAYTPQLPWLDSPGQLVLSDPAGEVIAEWDDFDPGPGWVPAVREDGLCLVLYAGGVFTHADTPGQMDFAGLMRAAKAGLLLGALVTTEVIDPHARQAP